MENETEFSYEKTLFHIFDSVLRKRLPYRRSRHDFADTSQSRRVSSKPKIVYRGMILVRGRETSFSPIIPDVIEAAFGSVCRRIIVNPPRVLPMPPRYKRSVKKTLRSIRVRKARYHRRERFLRTQEVPRAGSCTRPGPFNLHGR